MVMEWIANKFFRFENVWTTASERKKFFTFLLVYTVIFLCTFFLAYGSFLLAGKSFIWQGDGRAQHYPAVVYIGRYLRQIVLNVFNGNFSIPLFDLNIGMGGDIIATLNYYGFGDPLYLFSIFVPTRYIEIFFDFCVIFRIYLAGLAFVALCKYNQKRYLFALIGAIIYIFSGYAILTAVRHPFFTNPMIQLPLLLIGMDMIRNHKKPFLFILALSYSALCGFYFLYMMTIMLAVYGLISYFSINKIKEFLKDVLFIILYYLLGLGLVAIIFLPAVLGFLYSSRSGATTEFNPFSYGFNYYQGHLLKFIAPAPSSWNSLSLAAISLLSLSLMFCARKKYKKLKLLFLAGMIIYLLPLGGYIMNGFSYPSQRWDFGFVLLISYIVVETLPVLLAIRTKDKIICVLVLMVYMLFVLLSSKTRGVYYIVGVAMLAITFVVILFVNSIRATNNKQNYRWFEAFSVAAFIALVVINVSVNALYKFAPDLDKYINQFAKSGYETEIMENAIEREAEAYLSNKDGRFDSTSFNRNVGMVWQTPTMFSYWSMINKNLIDLWKQTDNIGQRTADCVICGLDERTIMGTLLSNKYFIDKPDKVSYVPYGYYRIEETLNDNLIYENQYALPWGYTYDSFILYEDVESLNGLEKEELMLQSIILDRNIDGVGNGEFNSLIVEIPYEITQMKNLELNEDRLKVNNANAILKLDFQVSGQIELYLCLKNLNIDNSGQSNFTVTVNCDDINKTAEVLSSVYTWYFGRENYLFNLGYSEDERTNCTITFPNKGTFKLENIELYALSMDNYPEQVEKLREESLENIEWQTNKISGTVDLSNNKILCMSIPYSKGWSARVDGETVEILRGNYMFMALPLTSGYHEIEFTYWTPGIRLGGILSMISWVVLVVMIICYRYKKGKCHE